MSEENKEAAQGSEDPQEINVNIDTPDITTLTIKDGDVLVVHVPTLPTTVFRMVKKKLEQDLEQCGIKAHVILLDNKYKMTVVSKDSIEETE